MSVLLFLFHLSTLSYPSVLIWMYKFQLFSNRFRFLSVTPFLLEKLITTIIMTYRYTSSCHDLRMEFGEFFHLIFT